MSTRGGDAIQGGRSGAQPKLKRTFYLDREFVVALAEIQAEELRDTGHKPDLSELIARAIRLLGRGRRSRSDHRS